MATQQPSYQAYTVVKREGQDDFWLNVGLAFPHKDGKGFNIMLQAFPLDGKIVCREIDDAEHAEEPGEQPGKTSRGKQQERRTSASR